MVWLKEKRGGGANLQPRILYPIRLLFRINGEIKFYRPAKAKTIQYNQTSLTTNPKGTSLGGKEKGTRKLQMGKLISKANKQ